MERYNLRDYRNFTKELRGRIYRHRSRLVDKDTKETFRLEEPNLPSSRYSYSNPSCQGALLCETEDFPCLIDKDKYNIFDGYFDRIQVWWPENYQKAFDLVISKEHSYLQILQSASEETLQKFAQTIFGL